MLLSVFTCDTAMYLMFAPGFYGLPSSGSCIQTCAYDVRDETRDRERKEELCVCVCFNFCVCVCMLVEDVDYRVIFQWAMLECTAVVVLPVLGLFWLSEGC